MQRKPTIVTAADARTLRLAAPAVTEDAVRAFLRYVEALTLRLERDGPQAESIAAARDAAKAASGLDAMTASALEAVVARFCSVVRPRRQLQEKLTRTQRALDERPSAELRERIERIRAHLAQDSGRIELERLYGAEGLAVLYKYQDDLVPWTDRRDAAERRAG